VVGPGGEDKQPLALALAQEHERVALGVGPAQAAAAQRVVGAAQPGQPTVAAKGGPVPDLGPVPGERLAGAGVADALHADLVPGEHHRRAGHGEQQPGRDLGQVGVADHAADPGRVVRPQQRPRGRRRPPRDGGQERPDGGRHRLGRQARHLQRQPAVGQAHLGMAQPGPDRLGEAGVVHGAVPAVAGQVAGGVVGMLGQQQRARPDLVHGRPQGPGHLGVEVVGGVPAGHVGHVDPPAVQVEGWPQPAPGDRVGASKQPAAQLGRGEAELRQAGVAQPALVGVVLGAGEVEERPLRRTGVLQGPAEPGVGVAAVVGGQVAEQVPAAGVDLLGEAGQGLVAAEQWVDLLEAGGVVAVVGFSREERRQVEGVDAERGKVVQALDDAVQVPAIQLPPAVPGGTTGS